MEDPFKETKSSFIASEPVNIPSKDGTELWFKSWQPDSKPNIKGSAVFIHALGGHSSRYDHFFEDLARHGLLINAFDQRNHGHSSISKQEKIDDLLDDFHAAFQKTDDSLPRFIIASGNGVVLALDYVMERVKSADVRIDGIICVAPVLAKQGKSGFRNSWSKVKEAFALKSDASTSFNNKRMSRDPEVVKSTKSDRMVKSHSSLSLSNEMTSEGDKIFKAAASIKFPILVLFGEDDKIADLKITRKFFDKVSSADKVMTSFPKLYHDILNEPEKEQVFKAIRDWILARSSESPKAIKAETEAKLAEDQKKALKQDLSNEAKKEEVQVDVVADTPTTPKVEEPKAENPTEVTKTEEPKEEPKPVATPKEKKVVPGKRTAVDFEFGRVLGEGAFGEVKVAKEIKTGQEFAIKVLNKKHILSSKKEKYVHTERNIFNSLNHPNTVKLWYTFQDPINLYYVLELCPNGNLAEAIKKNGKFSEAAARFYTAEIVSGLEHMHSKGIIHRDLKPDNVLLDPHFHVKLTDFGTSKIIGTESRARSESFCGTEAYVSPELLDIDDPYALKASDLWALGVMIFQMLTGKLPFKGETQFQTFELIRRREFEFPAEVSDHAKDIIDKLLISKPEERIGALDYDTLKKHPFFEGIDFATLHQQRSPLDPSSGEPATQVTEDETAEK